MAEFTPSEALELEIQRLLQQGQPPELVVESLINKFDKFAPSRRELETLAIFSLHSGAYATLNDFMIRTLKKNGELPWAHFCESLFLSAALVSEKIKQALMEGAKEQNLLTELSRSHMLDSWTEEMERARAERKNQLQKKNLERKKELLGQADLLHSQGLIAEEGKLLDRLLKIFPQDTEVKSRLEKRKEDQALDLLQEPKAHKARRLPLDLYQPRDPEVQAVLDIITAAMKNYWNDESQDFQLGQDFAVAQLMWENYEAGLEMAKDWLRAELLLRARHFVDLLSELQILEKKYGHWPETTFAVLYLRGQGLWGLGQKSAAIEVMENLWIARPHYRSSGALLSEWREDLA